MLKTYDVVSFKTGETLFREPMTDLRASLLIAQGYILKSVWPSDTPSKSKT